jgi:serine/threonine protein kinase
MKIKHYEIEKLIGKGSFGDVYKGVDTRNGNTIALKLDTSGLKVLKHEVSILNYLYSENVSSIPKILWFGVIDNVSILTMTYYKTSLQDYFDVKGIIDEFKMSSIMIKCLDILRQISIAQVMHRDIKPHNFMLADGELNLIDFGLSTIYSYMHSDDDILCEKEDLVGTPRFTSFYSHCGEPTSPRDDLLSLGYMYIYLNTGSLPWDEIERKETDMPLCNINHPDNLIRRDMKSPTILLPNLTGSLKNYMDYCYSLKCDDIPDYHNLMRIFTS